jgi:hypothetical protein
MQKRKSWLVLIWRQAGKKRVAELEKEQAKEKEKELACMKAEKKRAAELKRRIAYSVAELAGMNLEVSKLEMEGDRKNTFRAVFVVGNLTDLREEECIVEKELALNAEKKRVVELEKMLDDRNAEVTKCSGKWMHFFALWLHPLEQQHSSSHNSNLINNQVD